MPFRLLSTHSLKKVMAVTWFFDDHILRLEAWTLDKAANRAARRQPVHDCRILILVDPPRLKWWSDVRGSSRTV